MKRSRFVRSERGAAMVEMALVLPIVILLFLGMIDFGRAIFLYNNLANAAREGARYGSAKLNPGPVKADVESYTNARVRDFSGNAAAPSKAVATITTSSVTVDIVNYPFTPITPLPMVQSLNLNVRAVFRWEGAS